MSETDYNFQRDLKNSIFNADPKLDRKELIKDIFKAYVAKLFEKVVVNGRMPYDVVVQVRNNLISEFRLTELSEYQMSIEQYELLFDETVKEILDLAAMRHKGIDTVDRANQNFEINPEIYINEGGLIKPVSAL